MSAEIPVCPLCHTENAENEGKGVVLGLPELSNVYSTHHDDSSSATESQDAATEVAGSSSQRQDPGEGMSSPIGTAKGNTCQLCGAIINDKGEITGTSKSTQRKLVSDEEKRCRRHQKDKVGKIVRGRQRGRKTTEHIEFCEATTSDVHAVLGHAPADLRGVAHHEKLTSRPFIEPAKFQVFRGAYILLRV